MVKVDNNCLRLVNLTLYRSGGGTTVLSAPLALVRSWYLLIRSLSLSLLTR